MSGLDDTCGCGAHDCGRCFPGGCDCERQPCGRNEWLREQCLKGCPGLYAHLADIEQIAEPFYGPVDVPDDEDAEDIFP